MFKTLFSGLRKLYFHYETAIVFVGAIFLIALSILLRVYSAVHLDAPEIESIADAGIAGGVFALFLKAFQFTGVFSRALGDVIYTDKYLGMRKDLEDHWRRVTLFMCDASHPLISERISEHLLLNYIPRNFEFYCDRSERIIHYELIDPKRQIVKYQETMMMTVVATSTGTTVPYITQRDMAAEYCVDGVVKGINCLELKSLEINGVERKNDFVSDEDSGRGALKIELKGEKKYTITKKVEGRLSLLAENCFIQFVKMVHLRTSVTLHVDWTQSSEAMVVELAKYGTIGSFKHNQIAKNSHSRADHYEYDDILLPRQGYVLNLKVLLRDV